MRTQYTIAVKSLRDYLVALLEEEKWCSARMVGHALEQLIDSFPKQVTLTEGFMSDAKQKYEPTPPHGQIIDGALSGTLDKLR